MMPTKFTFQICAILVSYYAISSARVLAETGAAFQRGHVFVSLTEPESCDFGGREWIVEIDPQTGDWSVLADSDDGLCGVSGLRFTPDGSRLLALSYGHFFPDQDGGWVQSFAPDGTSEIILDETNGMDRSHGDNALAFDRHGSLFVHSGRARQIIRFAANGGSGTVVASAEDGLWDWSSLEFAPNGDLFFIGTDGIRRLTLEGESADFDPDGFGGLSIDRFANLYVMTGATLFRYDQLVVDQHSTIASGFEIATVAAVTRSGERVYVMEGTRTFYTINPADGLTTPVVQITDLSDILILIPRGIAIHEPVVQGDIDADGDVDSTDFAVLAQCQTGPGAVVIPIQCHVADIDIDGDIDIGDYYWFQNVFDVVQ